MTEGSTKLLDEFASWLTAAGDPTPDDTADNAAIFLDWRRAHADRDLGAVDEDDIVEFLLDWCPRKIAAGKDASSWLCASVGAFLEFLGDTDRLAGGADRGAGLSNLAMSLAGAMHTMASNPESSAKSILTHPGFNPPGKPRYIELLAQPDPMPQDELEAELRSRMAEFNALPFEEDEPVELPFMYVPPRPADVEEAVAAAPLLVKIDALRDYLGEPGKPLTAAGNIKLADGRALIELLDTGDVMEMQFDDRTFRKSTTDRLPGLKSIVSIAKQAGAVRVHQRRLVPVKTWSRNSATQRATRVYHAIVEIGALGSRGSSYPLFETVDEVLDGGIVHWLAGLLAPGSELDVDDFVDTAEPILRDEIEPYWPQWSDNIERMARQGISGILETLEAGGVIEWRDRQRTVMAFSDYATGGTIRLTAFGRHVVPDHLDEAGYLLRRVDDLADAPASALMDALDVVPDEQRKQVVDAWQPGLDVAERVQQIVDIIGSTDDPSLRLKGFAALELFDSAAVGLAVRGLLNGPTAGLAAAYLMSRGLADEAEVGHHVDIGTLVDVLAASVDDPEELCEMFAAAPQAADEHTALEQMWRHPAPETQVVLEALGAHLPDKKLAKAARKAAMKHRSWMSDRN